MLFKQGKVVPKARKLVPQVRKPVPKILYRPLVQVHRFSLITLIIIMEIFSPFYYEKSLINFNFQY
jgi:hypothetical protein